MDEAVQCVQRKRDQQLADMASLASLVTHLKTQLESKAQACMDAIDETTAAVTTTLRLKVCEHPLMRVLCLCAAAISQER